MVERELIESGKRDGKCVCGYFLVHVVEILAVCVEEMLRSSPQSTSKMNFRWI
jgi:hypothetical protein